MDNCLRVNMLGEFSLKYGDSVINDQNNRSNKVWLLIAYMLQLRGRNVSQNEMIDLLWGGEESSTNPQNALKTIMHRARTLLDELEPGMGKKVISRTQGGYCVSKDVKVVLDVDEFEQLCKNGGTITDEVMRMKCRMNAIDIYKGDLLPRLSGEMWVVPLSAYYHNLYIQTVHDAVEELQELGRSADVEAVCRLAIDIEPSDETLYYHLMRSMLDSGNQQAVINTYNSLCTLLYSQFGVMPSDSVRAIYREAMRTSNERAMGIRELISQMSEDDDSSPGAHMCDYDFFKVLYQSECRSLLRSGNAVHLALVTVSGDGGSALSSRSLDICMDNLDGIIRTSLRRGDSAARCSVSQYIMMLPQANYENSCMVMDRIIKRFQRQYPHSPAELKAAVYPLVDMCKTEG